MTTLSYVSSGLLVMKIQDAVTEFWNWELIILSCLFGFLCWWRSKVLGGILVSVNV